MKIYVDTERIIYEVKRRPLIWKKQHEMYRDREARDAAWVDIAKKLVNGYENMDQSTQKEAERKIQQRWRTARDIYKKDKISNKQKKYTYFNMMRFLDGNLRGERGDAVNEEPDEVNSPPREWPEVVVQVPLPTNETPVQPPTSTPMDQTPSKETLTSVERAILTYLSNQRQLLENEDMAFFQSLQPALQNFTSYQKLLFRSKVLQIMMEMSSEQPPPAETITDDASSGMIKEEWTVYE